MQATTSAEVGQTAPDFKLKGPGGQFISLSEYRGLLSGMHAPAA
jgi:peroxiredoxin